MTGWEPGTSQTKLYYELGIKSMKLRRQASLSFFQNTVELFQYLNDPIPKLSLHYTTRF